MTPPRILVAGIGNIFFGDDAFGSEVARKLRARSWPEGVRVEDFGIRGFDLAFALLQQPELTIFIDAAPRGGEPGTLYKIEPARGELNRFSDGDVPIDAHKMDPMSVLALVKSMGGTSNRIVLIGCEPSPLIGDEGQMGLSPPVAAALDEAVRMVEETIANELSVVEP